MNDLIILVNTIKIASLAIAISSPFAFIVAIYITRNENMLKSILDFLINLTHSRLDFPVVMTSSTIITLEAFLILKPLLN